MKLSTLLGSPCIVTLAVAAAPALADTTISKDSTTPLDTLSAGNILIKKDAELSVATGAAITVNSTIPSQYTQGSLAVRRAATRSAAL